MWSDIDQFLEFRPKLQNIKVIITNALSDCTRLLIYKILNGSVFGKAFLVQLTLLTNAQQEIIDADDLKNELEKCAFACTGSIQVGAIQEIQQSSLETADIIIFSSNLPNPNRLSTTDCGCVSNTNNSSNKNSTVCSLSNTDECRCNKAKKEQLCHLRMVAGYLDESFTNDVTTHTSKPIVLADGLISLHILKRYCTKIPTESLYCPTPLQTIAMKVLQKYLKATSDELSDVRIWAADDMTFHVEVDRPILRHGMLHEADTNSTCDSNLLDKDFMESRHLDYVHFNESWLVKELKEKMRRSSMCNPYSSLSNSRLLADALRIVWSSKDENKKNEIYCNLGVVSAGNVLALPVLLQDGKWTVNMKHNNNTQLKNELRNISKTAQRQAKCLDRDLSEPEYASVKRGRYCSFQFFERKLERAFPAVFQQEDREWKMERWGF